jgi:hypothetical protein
MVNSRRYSQVAQHCRGHSWSMIHQESGITKSAPQRTFHSLPQITASLAR